MDAYVEEVFKLENICSSTKILRKILDVKYEKANLNKVMNEKFQHLSENQRNDLIRLLQNSNICSMGF